MNLKEITFRNDAAPVSTEESLYLLKEYIRIRKGVTTELYINRKFGLMTAEHQLRMMGQAYCYASSWLKFNWKEDYE